MGMGSEKVEMQFLSDIFVQCPLCHGSRYGSEVLSVYRDGRNIADVLGMTVAAALECFSAEKGAKASRIASKLGVLQRVGLGHLTLGQPLNTLSGGENQRLKLAKILLDQIGSGANSSKMLILDEPGTGLHFADIEVLLAVFRELVEQGHTLLVIEHNPEFIKSADYVIDLGPEGGAGGGHVVATGTPEEIVAAGKGYTGKYLREVLEGNPSVYDPADAAVPESADMDIPEGVMALRGARHHNLKNVDLDVPRGEMTVLTGLSGSGKSSLAFDIFFAEGQRRFMDVMSPYARQFTEQLESPDIDRLTGLPPRWLLNRTCPAGHQIHRGNRHGNLAIHASAVCQAGAYLLPAVRYSGGQKVGIGSGGAGGEGTEKHGGLALLAPSSGDARGITPTWPAGRKERDMRKCGWTANWFP